MKIYLSSKLFLFTTICLSVLYQDIYVHTQQSTYHYSERTLFRLINMKMSAKMVPWEMARYQPIFTLSFLSSSTSLITSLTTSPSLPSSITTLSSRKLIGLLICGLSTLQLFVPQLKGIGGRHEHLVTASHPCPP